MNVFNLISAGGGSGSGLYIWKKYAYTPAQDILNPSFTLTYTGTTKATISNANFDYMALPQIFGNAYIVNNDSEDMKTVCDFYDGFKSTLSNTYKFVVNTINRLELFYQGGSTYLYGINDGIVTTASTMNYWTTLDFVYNGTKTLPDKIGDMVGYVVSDKEDAYPDGGEQGGFYYERFTPFSHEDMHFTHKETGTYTATSTTRYPSIPVPAYTSPAVFFMYTDDDSSGSYITALWWIKGRNSDTGIILTYDSGKSRSTAAGSQSGNTNVTISNSVANVKAGTTYKWVMLY